ncbi:hypothetical protein WJX77_008997 [Trebouxia sp. C0004]
MVVTADLTAACLHTTHSSLPARWHSVTQPVVFVKEWGLTCRVRRAMKHHHRMEEWTTAQDRVSTMFSREDASHVGGWHWRQMVSVRIGVTQLSSSRQDLVVENRTHPA